MDLETIVSIIAGIVGIPSSVIAAIVVLYKCGHKCLPNLERFCPVCNLCKFFKFIEVIFCAEIVKL